jgi:hypothetical protein
VSSRVHVVHTDGSVEALKAVSGWSVQEEATPLTADDSSGAVGGFTVTFDPQVASPAHLKALRKLQVNLDDLGQGRSTGKGESIATQSGVPVLTVQSRLNQLAVNRKAKPYSGSFYGAVVYYLGLCGITDMTTVYVDASLQALEVVLVGWYQPVWQQLKKMAAVYHFEIALVSDKIIFRPLRQRIGQQYRDASVDWSIDDSGTAKTIVVNYYEALVLGVGSVTGGDEQNPTYEEAVSLGLVYPPGGWNDQVEVITVAANETKTVQIDLGASVSSVEQPFPVDLIGPYVVPSKSAYTVTNADGSPMPPAEWIAMGGRVHVAINDDSISATLTITGAGYVSKGPFSLSMHVVADGTDYSSLRLIGTGIAYVKKQLTLDTGVSDDLANQDVGVTIDNEFIQSEAQAYEVAQACIGRYMGAQQKITVTTTGINRIGDTGSYDFEPLGWLDGQVTAGSTLAQVGAQLNALDGGTTLADLSAWIAEQNVDGFTNQAFGNLAGARVIHDGSWYRIVSATIGPDSISYTAAMDMTCGDVTAELAPGATVADLSAAFAGKALIDWDARPVPAGVSA